MFFLSVVCVEIMDQLLLRFVQVIEVDIPIPDHVRQLFALCVIVLCPPKFVAQPVLTFLMFSSLTDRALLFFCCLMRLIITGPKTLDWTLYNDVSGDNNFV